MSEWGFLILLFIAVTIVVMVVGYFGNKIVDKGADAIHKREVEKYNIAHKNDSENLADRFK